VEPYELSLWTTAGFKRSLRLKLSLGSMLALAHFRQAAKLTSSSGLLSKSLLLKCKGMQALQPDGNCTSHDWRL